VKENERAVTIAPGTPSNSAIRPPTFFCNYDSGTKYREASSIACTISVGMMLPPRTVTTPIPLMTGRMPSEV
jgi:hypothetical protein